MLFSHCPLSTYRALHAERQEMLAQWEDKLETVRQRDEAIQKASERFSEKKGDLRRLKGEMDAQVRSGVESGLLQCSGRDAGIASAAAVGSS